MQARQYLPALAALTALSLALGPGANASPKTVLMATVDGRRQAYVVEGHGAPPLVMFTGLGADISTFDAVASDLSASTTILRIDRPGYGKSDPAPGGRDIDAVVRDYHSVIQQAGVPLPYVVLGHSLGGMYAEYYAARYPDEVAGLILEDTRTSDFWRRCKDRGIADKCAPSPAIVKQLPETMQIEVAGLDADADAIGAIEPTGKLPVLIMSSGASRPGDTEFNAVVVEAQEALARKYPGSVHVVAAGSGHFIHLDAKALFESSVRRFLAGLRH